MLGKDGVMTTKNPVPRKYPQEIKERAIRMVQETIDGQGGQSYGVVSRVAKQLGVGSDSLGNWINQAEVDGGHKPGVTTQDQQRIKELEREVKELRRANEILKAASAFFARELDPRFPR